MQWAIPVNEDTPPWKSKMAFPPMTMIKSAFYPSKQIKISIRYPKDQLKYASPPSDAIIEA